MQIKLHVSDIDNDVGCQLSCHVPERNNEDSNYIGEKLEILYHTRWKQKKMQVFIFMNRGM